MPSICDQTTIKKPEARFMKRRMWLRWAVLLAVGIFAARIFSRAQDNHNGILLFGFSQNAGNIKSGKEVHWDVTAFNFRLTPVSLSGVPNCGCTVAGDYDHTLMPFGVISVPLTISTTGVKEGPHTRVFALRFKSGETSWQRNATVRFSLAK